tara:strand:- start:49 stop:693 length:645 start_codon:yes stop_codon:yes gene_type:complete
MKQKVITYALMLVVILLSLQLFGNNAEFRNFKQQIAKFKKTELAYQEEVNKEGDRIIEQEQIILSQSDAIEQGLLEIGRLKRVNSQVHVVTNTIIDTIIVSHVDTVVQVINGNSYLKLPQSYSFNDEFINLNAKINEIGLNIDNITIFNESTITVGYKRIGFLKPLSPVIQIKNTNPYMLTQSVSNVVIEEKTDLLHDKRAWGVVGLFLGILIK